MDLWIIIKQRYVLISIFIIIILSILFLLGCIWKSRFNIPKTLTVLTIVICGFLIILSLLSLIFYNFFWI